MNCKLKKSEYVLKSRDFPLYVCTRRGCRGYGYDRGLGIPTRMCDHPYLKLGDLIAFFAFPVKLCMWFFGLSCNTCERRHKKANHRHIPSPIILKPKPWPWNVEEYKDKLYKVDSK